MLRVTCHLSLGPTATATDSPPTNSLLCTVGWFAKTPKTKIKQTQEIIKMAKIRNGFVTQIEMSLKLERHSNWNGTQIGTAHKLKCHSK